MILSLPQMVICFLVRLIILLIIPVPIPLPPPPGTGTTTTTHTEQVFDGFQYTHAVLVNFDSEGKIVWDQCFEMWPAYKPFYVKKFISLAQDNEDAINMVFVSKEQICSKSIDYSGKSHKR